MAAKKRLERTGVMLATPLDDKLLESFPNVCLAQPKLNGERCRAEWSTDNKCHTLFSSYGNAFVGLDHIEDGLLALFRGVSVDGELYVHGWTRERIHSIVSRKTNPHKDAALIEYHIFDIISDKMQIDRTNKLITFFSNPSLQIVESIGVTKEGIPSMAADFVTLGYEGMILRNPNGFYEPKRSKFLAKFKPSKTDRYLIIGSIEEVDKEGYPKNTLGALKVQDHSGNIFNVGTGNALTKLSRKHLWERRDTIPGRFAVVKHSLIYTNGGFPTCTSLVEVE